MEKINVVLLDECDKDREKLYSLLQGFEFVDIIGSTNSLKKALDLINNLEPNILFLAVKADDLNAFKFLEKIKKQPTIVFSSDSEANIETFKNASLLYLKKPYTLMAVQQLLNNYQKTHQQLANKMQGLLGKLKFEE
ncbi:MAG TPA: hypothetical protein VFM79_02940 [Pelobium sp.]|nr:hypothetical protein [Pelobium sp.]